MCNGFAQTHFLYRPTRHNNGCSFHAKSFPFPFVNRSKTMENRILKQWICDIVLYCSILFYIVLYCSLILFFIVLYCFYIVLYCSLLFYIVLYCSILFYIVLYCSILFFIVLYCSILFYIVLYCSILFYIVLYCSILFYWNLWNIEPVGKNLLPSGRSLILLTQAARLRCIPKPQRILIWGPWLSWEA